MLCVTLHGLRICSDLNLADITQTKTTNYCMYAVNRLIEAVCSIILPSGLAV